MSLDSFSRRIRIRAENVPAQVNKIVRGAVLAIDQAVVLATPVDTGRARSNWLVTLGIGASNIVPPYSPGSRLGVGESANAAGALAQARAAVAGRRPEQSVFITNNVDYISKLNSGSSPQAPPLFVQAGISAGVAAVAGARIDTRRRT